MNEATVRKEERNARLEAKYGGLTGSMGNGEKRQMNVGRNAGRDRAMAASGRPKDLKASVGRLIRYIAGEKVLIVTAVLCSCYIPFLLFNTFLAAGGHER